MENDLIGSKGLLRTGLADNITQPVPTDAL